MGDLSQRKDLGYFGLQAIQTSKLEIPILLIKKPLEVLRATTHLLGFLTWGIFPRKQKFCAGDLEVALFFFPRES